MKLETYVITIKALGYETLQKEVQAQSYKEVRKHIGEAQKEWAELNHVPFDDVGLITFMRVCKKEK